MLDILIVINKIWSNLYLSFSSNPSNNQKEDHKGEWEMENMDFHYQGKLAINQDHRNI